MTHEDPNSVELDSMESEHSDSQDTTPITGVLDPGVDDLEVEDTADMDSDSFAESSSVEDDMDEPSMVEKPAKKPKKAKSSPESITKEPGANEPVEFADLPLCAEVLNAVELAGYHKATSIQAAVIPPMIEGRDVLAQSQTGSGKTAAFALPILTSLNLADRSTQCLVLAPTRELAMQVARSFTGYGEELHGLSVAAIYGGQDYQPQLRTLARGAHIVVGTPGRVIDHVKRGTLDLSTIKTLVLDEADEMLNMGFLEDVEFILQQSPPDRQVALFSATMPPPIRHISQQYLKDPVRIAIESKQLTADSIRQRAIFVAPHDKLRVLKRFLEVEATDGVIVFVKTREATIQLAESLARDGFSAAAINGDMPQNNRERTISHLKSGRLNVLVATDVAARGLDVTRITHVFNFDLPHDSESYIHRVGRTGRAGRAGEAIIFLTSSQRHKLRVIEKVTKQKIELVDSPDVAAVNARRIERFFEKINQTIESEDLSKLQDLIASHAESTNQSIHQIAAALAQMTMHGRPFLLSDEPLAKIGRLKDRDDRRDFERRDFDDRPRQARPSRHDSGPKEGFQGGGFQGGGASLDGERRGKRFGPPGQGMIRYRLAVGHRDGVKVGNIVGAVANESGLGNDSIGAIRIHESFSTIDLPAGMPPDIFQILQKTRVGGRPLNIREWSDEPPKYGDRSERPERPERKTFAKRFDGPGYASSKPDKPKMDEDFKAKKPKKKDKKPKRPKD
jgi:ATP-dependent RNA helicase DeaD